MDHGRNDKPITKIVLDASFDDPHRFSSLFIAALSLFGQVIFRVVGLQCGSGKRGWRYW